MQELYGQVGDIWERGRALLAWKIDSRGTVVDVVVVPDEVIGGSTGAYRRRRGEETINTQHNIKHR